MREWGSVVCHMRGRALCVFLTLTEWMGNVVKFRGFVYTGGILQHRIHKKSLNTYINCYMCPYVIPLLHNIIHCDQF